MQKRFCPCGHIVLVRYLCSNGIWKPQMLLPGFARRKDSEMTCPSCGSPLSIHSLR